MKQKDILINITKQAALKIQEIIKKNNKKKNKLRIYILGGGCSGFQYKFIFESKTNEDDIVIKKLGISLIIDPITIQYITGGKIDFTENLEGSKFVILNPNAKNTCSCGSSFNI
ncbi:Iron-sulfur cluster insertion protein ErpA [Buchnera aphidicola (Tetraneura ulmi)]|uniref:iron-sulfur cluster insertion protein ErpA n=1 Tax=Buchnera aphidicola TaxID=9 RepID=UPI0034642FB7